MILSIDIGGTAVKMGLVDAWGHVEQQTEASVCFDQYRTPILKTVVGEARDFLARSATDIKGIGVSATGQIDTRTGVVIGADGKFPGYEGSAIKQALEAAFSVPVTVINDANAAALGECFTGRAAGLANVVMVTIGTGVGGGIVIGGQLYGGSRGIAGEIGHFTLYQDGPRCTCGKRGCFETYASTTALVRAACKAIGDPQLDGRAIFARAVAEDALLLGVIGRWLDDVAAGITGLVHIFNPQMVVIGGGVSAQTTLFIDPLRERVLSGVMPRFAEGLAVESATLGNQAGLIGAAKYFAGEMLEA